MLLSFLPYRPPSVFAFITAIICLLPIVEKCGVIDALSLPVPHRLNVDEFASAALSSPARRDILSKALSVSAAVSSSLVAKFPARRSEEANPRVSTVPAAGAFEMEDTRTAITPRTLFGNMWTEVTPRFVRMIDKYTDPF